MDAHTRNRRPDDMDGPTTMSGNHRRRRAFDYLPIHRRIWERHLRRRAWDVLDWLDAWAWRRAQKHGDR